MFCQATSEKFSSLGNNCQSGPVYCLLPFTAFCIGLHCGTTVPATNGDNASCRSRVDCLGLCSAHRQRAPINPRNGLINDREIPGTGLQFPSHRRFAKWKGDDDHLFDGQRIAAVKLCCAPVLRVSGTIAGKLNLVASPYAHCLREDAKQITSSRGLRSAQSWRSAP